MHDHLQLQLRVQYLLTYTCDLAIDLGTCAPAAALQLVLGFNMSRSRAICRLQYRPGFSVYLKNDVRFICRRRLLGCDHGGGEGGIGVEEKTIEDSGSGSSSSISSTSISIHPSRPTPCCIHHRHHHPPLPVVLLVLCLRVDSGARVYFDRIHDKV